MTKTPVPGEGKVVEHSVFWGGHMEVELTSTGLTAKSQGSGNLVLMQAGPKVMAVILKPEGI